MRIYLQQQEDGSYIETLRTGDGKACYTSLTNNDDIVALGINYGNGTGSIGEVSEQQEGMLPNEAGIRWMIEFKQPESIDALISELERTKALFKT